MIHAKKVDGSPIRHLQMGRQSGTKGLRHTEVCMCRIGRMQLNDCMYFYNLLFFIIHVLSIDKFGNLLIYFNLSIMCCI